MKIAFASCACAPLYPQQPVWAWIQAQQPDHLVLLGDSIYLDVPVVGTHPQDMLDDEFAQHLYRLYSLQLNQPEFASLIKSMPKSHVWSIWDDHDFLWNDALGALHGQQPVHQGKVRLSTAFQEAWRHTLAHGLAAGSWPGAYNDPVFWPSQPAPLSTPSIPLAPDVWLHLTDGRTWRTQTWLLRESRRTLLGDAQRQALQATMAAAPQALHLMASGSTLADYKKRYPRDWSWLLGQAAKARTLVLSGDIHRNESDAYFTGGLPLHEATSSGAAVKDAVIVGKMRRNFGVVDVGDQHVSISLFADNKLETKWSRKLDRGTWLPV
jgi:alkaline phosphatase D